jgi:hypothetical protein
MSVDAVAASPEGLQEQYESAKELANPVAALLAVVESRSSLQRVLREIDAPALLLTTPLPHDRPIAFFSPCTLPPVPPPSVSPL